ncbi:hypothetical protein DFH09DRAFT_1080050 [Mycena vulgaris]|nr:hypothetical protein DFH09DRAFT_1080050 [Mycena vulgaris]
MNVHECTRSAKDKGGENTMREYRGPSESRRAVKSGWACLLTMGNPYITTHCPSSCTEQFAQEKDCTDKGSVAEPSPIEGVTAMIQERMRIIPPAPLERARAERRISFNAQQPPPVASAVHLGGWAWRHQGKIRGVRIPTPVAWSTEHRSSIGLEPTYFQVA